MRSYKPVKGILLAALMSTVVGCTDTEYRGQADVSVVESDSSGVRVVTIRGPVSELPEWQLDDSPIAMVDGNAPPYIASVGVVALLANGDFVVFDRQNAELFRFGADGTGVRTIANGGDGPGELRTLETLEVSPANDVYAFDRRQNRITVFDADGSYSKAIALESGGTADGFGIRHAWIVEPDRTLMFGLLPGQNEATNADDRRVRYDRMLRMYSHDGTMPSSIARFSGEFVVSGAMGELGSPFSNRPFADVGRDRIVAGSGSAYELFVHDYDLAQTMVVRWLGWSKPLNATTIDSLRVPMAASLDDLRAFNPSAADQMLDDLFHSDVLPRSWPALGSAMVDELGRIWVSDFRPTVDLRIATTGGYEPWNQQDAWHILDANGHPLARLRLPAETRLLAVRGDRVAVVSRDEDEVESVSVFAINSGGATRD